VGLVAFHASGAELLLPPIGSAELAETRLGPLSTGGRARTSGAPNSEVLRRCPSAAAMTGQTCQRLPHRAEMQRRPNQLVRAAR
jgi:hypothetical protein